MSRAAAAWRLGALALAGGVLLLAGRAGAADTPVPVELQVALFQKIFNYDEQLGGAKSIQVVVAYGPNRSEAEAIAAAFSKRGVLASTVPLGDLADEIARADVVYAAPDINAKAVGKLCAAHQKLSISGQPSDAEDGAVSVSLEVKPDGRPQIIVNLKQTGRENHKFAGQFLAVTRLVQ